MDYGVELKKEGMYDRDIDIAFGHDRTQHGENCIRVHHGYSVTNTFMFISSSQS